MPSLYPLLFLAHSAFEQFDLEFLPLSADINNKARLITGIKNNSPHAVKLYPPGIQLAYILNNVKTNEAM